jgi:protein-tyrosine-phosphatase
MNETPIEVPARIVQALEAAERLRFLCTGNMVRSAFAEVYALHLGCPKPVDSAATIYQNSGLYPETRLALQARGVSAQMLDAFRSRQLDSLSDKPDAGMLVFGMTHTHLDAWVARYPGHGNALLLSEVLGSQDEIADPVLDGADFGQAFARVASAVEAIVGVLKARS